MFVANKCTTSGYIFGEIKLAITLRLLAGGSCYNLAVMFDIHYDHCNKIMLYVLKHWINNIDVGNINIDEYLDNIDEMKKVSEGFLQRSNSILKGAIGALYGWLVRIERQIGRETKLKMQQHFFLANSFMLSM